MTGDRGRESVLDGLLVVELGERVGAATCAGLLAELGADVVSVEAAQGGRSDTKVRFRDQLAAGKLSLLVDNAADRALLARLVERADVVVTSSDLDRLRLGEDDLPAGAPDTIVCDVTAFGSTGPMAGAGWSELQIQAVTGVLDATGHPGQPPSPISIPLIEHVAGTYAAGAALCALRLRRRRAIAQAIEIALYDVGFSLMTSFLPTLLAGDGHAPISRVGNRQTMVAPWNVYPARDGWLLLCAGSDEQWRRICREIGRDALGTDPAFAGAADRLARVLEVDAAVGEWTRERTVNECVDRFGRVAIPCGPITAIDDFPADPNLAHREMIRAVPEPASGRNLHVPGSPLRMSLSPGQPPRHIPTPGSDRDAIERYLERLPHKPPLAGREPVQPPLAGLRILEIGHYTTAPLAARHLANLGAEVIKIESPAGEAVRRWPPARDGQGIFFTFQNADKKSVVLDIDEENGRVALAALIRGADVLIENLKPGALAKRGFSADEIAAMNPRLVYCAVSGFGHHSLYAGRPAFDAVIQAMSGLMDVIETEGEPLKTGPSSADIMGAAAAFLAIVAALEFRDVSGRGQFLDISMQDWGAWATRCAWNGRAAWDAHILAAQDGFVLVEGEYSGLAADKSGMADCGIRNRAELVQGFAAQGLRAAPVLNVEDVVTADQTLARRLWFVASERGIDFPLLASPLRLRLTPATVTRPGPSLGRDTRSVLGTSIGADEYNNGAREERS